MYEKIINNLLFFIAHIHDGVTHPIFKQERVCAQWHVYLFCTSAE